MTTGLSELSEATLARDADSLIWNVCILGRESWNRLATEARLKIVMRSGCISKVRGVTTTGTCIVSARAHTSRCMHMARKLVIWLAIGTEDTPVAAAVSHALTHLIMGPAAEKDKKRPEQYHFTH